MRSTHPARNHQQTEHAEAARGRPVPPTGMQALPGWESFPVADRHQVISAILRVARRQVETGPTTSVAQT